MDIYQILSHVDHTLLSREAGWEDIRAVIDDGIKYKTASVCIPASFVLRASQYAKQRVAICTVIGFPNGYSTTASKVFETADAVGNGADEIDMVINTGDFRDGLYEKIEEEINAVKDACGGKILKVIVETCLLTPEEKAEVTKVVSRTRADFIKTSTGFSNGGATREDVRIFAQNRRPDLKIKAAGGIKSLDDARDFLALGADRLGTSSIVKAVKSNE